MAVCIVCPGCGWANAGYRRTCYLCEKPLQNGTRTKTLDEFAKER